MKYIVIAVVVITLLFLGTVAAGDETFCNANNPKNCPQGAPNPTSPICGKGEHTGNPHCTDKDDSKPTPTPTLPPVEASPTLKPTETPTPTPHGKTPAPTVGPQASEKPAVTPNPLKQSPSLKPGLPPILRLPSTSTN